MTHDAHDTTRRSAQLTDYIAQSVPPLKTDTEGVQTNAPAQPDLEKTVKRVLAGVVAFATVGATQFPPHTIAFQVCVGIVGLGAALGITSKGVQ
jgi:hypothetical protein